MSTRPSPVVPTLFPYQETLGFDVTAWEPGRIRLTLAPKPELLDENGGLSRGVQSSLLDAATGLAACFGDDLENRPLIVTLGLTTQYLQPCPAGPVETTAHIVHRDGKILLSEGELRSENGQVVAKATANLRYIIEPPADQAVLNVPFPTANTRPSSETISTSAE